MAKVVLVSHLERNKKISIPEHNSEGDIDYLRREFLKNFYFERNVKLQITFQQFDPEWEEYVDLEEDAVVQHKDKLKAIVTPRLSDSAPTTSASASVTDEAGTEFEKSFGQVEDLCGSMEGDEGLGSEINRSSSLNCLPKCADMDSDDDDTLHPPKRKRLRVLEDDLVCSEVYSNPSTCTTASTCTVASACTTAYQADTESKDSKEYILVGVPKSIKKTKEESTPLPDPFPLPTNFRPDVHLCLAKKKMTKASRAAFYTAVAAAMFQYKRYPSRDDFVSVARQIIAKYPFLGSKSFGASHDGIVQTLIDRFKDMRRLRKPRPAMPKKEQVIVKKPPGSHNPLALPEVPAGEDDISFERHNRLLKSEWMKPKRNAALVEELMERTFAMRRREIIENSCDVKTLFKKFPFLQDPEQLMKELERVTNVPITQMKRDWTEKWVPKILEQARFEATTSSAASTVCAEMISLGEDNPLIALAVLIYLLPDSRSKPDHSKVLYFSQASSCLQDVVRTQKQRTPYFSILHSSPRQAFLIVDKAVVCESKLEDIPVLLMSAFFSFNICYPPGCNNYFALLECVLLGFKGKLPASVKHLLAALD